MINYKKGDATNIKPDEILVHVCNDIGKWGAGFVLAISKKFKQPERSYREWYKNNTDFKLGEVDIVPVSSNRKFVANLIGQVGIRKRPNGDPPIDYPAIELGLKEVAWFASYNKYDIIMPRIGCGLAGGEWKVIEEIINRTLISEGIKVTVYDF